MPTLEQVERGATVSFWLFHFNKSYLTGAAMNEFIKISLQEGDPKENGINGCCVGDVLTWCLQTIAEQNIKETKKENTLILKSIDNAIFWLKSRNSNE